MGSVRRCSVPFVCVARRNMLRHRHYYSFIRDRSGDELGRWMMFNDSSVSFFNPDHIEREAFGGEETFRYAGYGAARVGAYSQTRSIMRNAFVLFYDRVTPKVSLPKEVAATAAASGTSSESTAALSAEALAGKLVQRNKSRKVTAGSRSPVPPTIFQAIWEDNQQFWRERNIFDDNYYEFLLAMVNAGGGLGDAVPYPVAEVRSEFDCFRLGGAGISTARLATLFIMNTLSTQATKGSTLLTWINRLSVRVVKVWSGCRRRVHRCTCQGVG